MMKTPITPIQFHNSDNNIYMKREDLLPTSFGGNKIRIAEEFFEDMKTRGADCIIGYGSTRSNLCRAIANMACAKGIPCHIIVSDDADGQRAVSANSDMVTLCNAICHPCSKQNVAETVKSVMEECRAMGLTPYYINGDEYGKGNEAVPVRAYFKAYREMQEQSEEMDIKFDYIFLATGTGMTQAGLLAGKMCYNGAEKIVGISISRDAEKEQAVISNYINAFLRDKGVDIIADSNVYVCDDYTCGGYGKYNEEAETVILNVFRENGVALDPTYTGKAFYGMCEWLQKNEIQGKNILFLHTGGTPLFFDYLKRIKRVPDVTECRDVSKTIRFLQEIDQRLPVPLSERIDLNEYANKIIQNGQVLAIETEDRFVAAAMFYCNDTEKRQAYLTLLGTLQEYEGYGCGNLLMGAMEEKCRMAGMQTLHLYTERANTRAVSFYSRRGYVIGGVDKKVHMVKEL